ncbi:MAG: hypothetical protein AAB011_05085 [Candidatus Eisenbacteria bacterium]
MATNGIGPLVRQWVHERNDARRATRSGEGATPAPEAPAPTVVSDDAVAATATTDTATATKPVTVDTATFTPEALARFEAWKTRHGVTAPNPEPIVTQILTADPVDTIFLPLPGTTNGEPA